MNVFIQKVLVILYKKNLFFVSFYGIIFLNLLFVKQFMFLKFKNNFFFLQTKNCCCFQFIFNCIIIKSALYVKLKNLIFKIDKLYFKKLSLLGIGFKSWVVSKNNYNFYMLKIGFSFDLCYFVFSNVKFICLKSTLILLKSLDKQTINQTAINLCSIKKWNLYKIKGIFYFNDKIKTKILKKN